MRRFTATQARHRTKIIQPALSGEDRVESELCEKHNWQGT